jgi:hypothetical protein
MVPDAFHDFFLATASASGALVGLMFVAISIARQNPLEPGANAIDRVRASSALIALVAPLLVALIALLPGRGLGVSAMAVAGLSILYSASALRRLAFAEASRRDRIRAVGVLATFLGVMVVEFVFGLILARHVTDSSAVGTIAAILIASLGLGISHAWELVGGQATSALVSIGELLGRGDEAP